MTGVVSPLDAILHITNPTTEERLLQHARKLEIALEQDNARRAMCEFNLMMRLYNEIRGKASDQK